jgi:hypothetical protein
MKKLTTILLFFATTLSAQKIPVTLENFYQDNTFENTPANLIDGDINTEFLPAWNFIYKPHDVVCDLSDYKATLKKIRIYDGNGGGFQTKLLAVNEAGDTAQIGTFTGTSWPNQWVEFTCNVPAVTFIMRGEGGPKYGNELELIGDYTPYTEPVYNRSKKPLKNFLMVNAHPWDIDSNIYPAKYKALIDLGVTGVRLYSDSYADKDSLGNWAMNPELRGFKVDSNLYRLKRDGFLTHLCYQNQSLQVRRTWINAGKVDENGNSVSHLNLSYQFNYTRDLPESHIEMGRDLFVLASRGGTNKNVPDYPIYHSPNSWDERNKLIKGGNFYSVIEGGNEWNAWWKGYDGFMNGKQLGPAHSMWYDGHKGQFQNAGAKTADPNILLSANGLASDKPDIYRSIHAWSKKHRGYKNGVVDLPFDIIQFHCYSSIGGQYSDSKGGLPPETGMMPQVRNMIHFSNKYAGGMPVMIGEWGWDVHPLSPLNAPAYGKYTAQQTRGNWFIRGVVLFGEAGLDYAEGYRLYQEWPNRIYDNVAQQFSTMAFLRQIDDQATVIERTLQGDYLKQLSAYGNYIFKERLPAGDKEHVLKFSNGSKDFLIGWKEENMTIVDGRPSFTENTGIYNIPAGSIIKRFQQGDVMSSEFGSFVTLGSEPVIIELNGSSLPVKLLSWTATKSGKSVLLKWSVEESEFSHYEVEKSSDGVNFVKWATVSGGQRDYSMYDLFPFPTTYYRLKMVDLDGSYSYSKVISIRMNGSKFKVYNLAGQEVQNPRSGFYLKVYEDGTKEYVKL